MKKLIVFDLDGTLTDSGPGIASSVSHALSALGAAPQFDVQLLSGDRVTGSIVRWDAAQLVVESSTGSTTPVAPVPVAPELLTPTPT